jgi:hypothetical protein
MEKIKPYSRTTVITRARWLSSLFFIKLCDMYRDVTEDVTCSSINAG